MSNRLAIAMVHYHLRRGGVTRVIQNALAALDPDQVDAVVLTGEAPPGDIAFSAPVQVVSGLAYDEGQTLPAPEALLRAVQAAARAALGRDPDIWHIHNHTLGKNAAWTAAVARMSAAGQALVLHIHDFAEDGRPANYRYLSDRLGGDQSLSGQLYPQAGRTHYVLLNQRDEKILCSAGIDEDRVHRLPNAVWTGDEAADAASGTARSGAPLVLYPTRAIRRKNIGEFLLWSAMDADTERRYGITLAPESPGEKPIYAKWKSFATSLRLPIEFEMGLAQSFPDLIQSAERLVTTSIAEGFGLAFLEPWLMGRPLAGRKLPEITSEFEAAGISLDGLYDGLTVPADWIAEAEVRTALRESMMKAWTAYGREITPSMIDQAWSTIQRDGRIEFSRLDESQQEQIIVHVHASTSARSEVDPHDALTRPVNEKQLHDNRAIIQSTFGLPRYREQLMKIYEQAINADSRATREISSNVVLDQFLAPDRFYLLRS